MATASAVTADVDVNANLLDSLKNLYVSKNGFDLTLLTNDNGHVQCHAVVASANSPYIKECLGTSSHLSTSTQLTHQSDTTYSVDVKLSNSKVLSTIVDYFYTGQIQINADDIKEILLTATLLQLDTITDKCMTLIKHYISINNYQYYLIYGEKYKLEQLVSICHDFIADRFEQLLTSDRIAEIETTLFLNVLKNENCRVQSEDVILKGVVQWLKVNKYKHNKRKLCDISKRLLDCVRFEHCSSVSLYEVLTEPSDLFSKVQSLLNRKCLIQVCCVRAEDKGEEICMVPHRNYKQVSIN